MIVISESWTSIFHRIGERPPRRNRARCPIHDGNSPQSLSVCEEKSVFHCHVCHASGDKISFVMQYLKCNFGDALRFFGLEPGVPPAPDPEWERQRKIREGLRAWAKKARKELRDEFYVRQRVLTRARKRLRRDAQDEMAWNWLAWALPGLDAIEHKLDKLSGSDSEIVEAYHVRQII